MKKGLLGGLSVFGFKLNAFKYQGTVRATKTEVIFNRYINLHITRGISAIIQIALWILIKNIDGRWRFLMMQSQHREHALYATRTTQQVASHGLG